MDYTKYSDKHVRNKDNLTKAEEALADLQANQEVEEFFRRFNGEEKFLGRIADKLAIKLSKIYDRNETYDE